MQPSTSPQQETQFDDMPTASELEEVSKLARRQLVLELALESAEAHVKEINEQLKAVAEVALPEAMRSVGLRSFALDSGEKISIKEGVDASIRKEQEQQAFKWLRDNGFGDIIKSKVEVGFGRGDDEKARRLVAVLEREGFDDYAQKTGVHSGTLKAFAREQLGEGRPLPDEFFSVFSYSRAVIKEAT